MDEAAAVDARNRKLSIEAAARARIPTLAEVSLVIASALLLILAFPNFELWPLAWIGLVPFLMVVVRPLPAGRAFLLGWLWGAIGLLLAIPITGAMKIVFDHVESLKPYGAWLGE